MARVRSIPSMGEDNVGKDSAAIKQGLGLLFDDSGRAGFREDFERNRPGIYEGSPACLELISWRDLDHLFAFSPTYHGIEFLPKSGGGLGDDPAFPHPLALTDCYRIFSEGYSLLFPQMEKRWRAISLFCGELTRCLGFVVECDLLASMPCAAAFTRRSGELACFALQLSGASGWAVRADDSGKADPWPDGRISLTRGQLHYVPPGHHCEIEPSGEGSLFLWLRMKLTTWKNLLLAAVEHAADQLPAMRQGFILDDPNDDRALDRLVAELKTRLPAVFDHLDAGLGKKDLLAELIEAMTPVPSGHFEQIEWLGSLGPDTPVEHRAGVLGTVILTGDKVEFPFPGNELDGPDKMFLALEFILETPRFTPRQIPGWYSEEEQCTIVRSLIYRGYLRFADPAAAGAST